MICKEDFLKLDCVEDNSALDNYVDLINNAILATPPTEYSEKHHIIPVSYFNYKQLPVDNSGANLVRLSAFNHILAHYYLCLFFTSKLRVSMCYAFSLMTYENAHKLQLEDTYVIQTLEEYAALREAHTANLKSKKLSEETRKKLEPSWFKKGVSSWNKGIPCRESTKLKLREHNLQTPSVISAEGRAKISAVNSHPKSPETVEKMKAYSSNRSQTHLENLAASARGKTRANDGVKNRWWKRDTPLPDGWSWGWL